MEDQEGRTLETQPPSVDANAPPKGEHTPGPWTASPCSSGHSYSPEDMLAWTCLVECEAPYMDNGELIETQTVAIAMGRRSLETFANARLIAAVPDLFAALRPFAEAALELDDETHGEIWEMPVAMTITAEDLRAALAAIKKATGQ